MDRTVRGTPINHRTYLKDSTLCTIRSRPQRIQHASLLTDQHYLSQLKIRKGQHALSKNEKLLKFYYIPSYVVMFCQFCCFVFQLNIVRLFCPILGAPVFTESIKPATASPLCFQGGHSCHRFCHSQVQRIF